MQRYAPVNEMTCTVSSGTLNHCSVPYHTKDMHNGILHVQGSRGPWKLFLKFSGSGKSWKIRMVVKSHMEITLYGHRKFWHFAPIHISLLFAV